MMNGDDHSYLELCIAALPPEKREGARRAFFEISETGDDSYLNKLLVVLEANGSYAKGIPKEMTEAGARLVREMEGVGIRMAEAEARREASFKATIAAETTRLVGSMPVQQIASGIERQSQLLDDLRKIAREMDDRMSIGGAVLLAVFTFACGVAVTMWTFWDPYHLAQRDKAFCDDVADAGIHLVIERTDEGHKLAAWGPTVHGVTWLKDTGGAPYGTELFFNDPK